MSGFIAAALVWSGITFSLGRWLGRQAWGAPVVVTLIGLSFLYFVGLLGLLASFREVF